MKKLRMAMNEPQRGAEMYMQPYREMFGCIGYEIELVDINLEASSPSEIFNGQQVDVFVSDLSLGQEESYEGLKLIAEVKTEFPNLLAIGQSMSPITYIKAAEVSPAFDLFVSKTRIRDGDYKSYLQKQIEIKLNRNTLVDHVELVLSPGEKLSNTDLDINQLKDIVSVITFTSHNADPLTTVKSVRLTPLAGGYSSSDVFRFEAYTQQGLQCVNAVLKVAELPVYERELHNYLDYVKWYLPYDIKPELLGTCETSRYGAICYSFAYNDAVPFRSLADDLVAMKYDTLDLAINLIFSPSNKRWYGFENLKLVEDLSSYYYKKWFEGKSTAYSELDSYMSSKGQVTPHKYIVDGKEFDKPGQKLFGVPKGEYLSSICHGDLHGNNILISDEHGISLIDFNRTGRGHIFDDFITLEGNVRLYARLSGNLESCLEFERALSDRSFSSDIDEQGILDSVASDEYLKLHGRHELSKSILKIRDTAKRYSDSVDPKKATDRSDNYYYALALYCFRLLRLGELEEWQIEQLLACCLHSTRLAYSES